MNMMINSLWLVDMFWLLKYCRIIEWCRWGWEWDRLLWWSGGWYIVAAQVNRLNKPSEELGGKRVEQKVSCDKRIERGRIKSSLERSPAQPSTYFNVQWIKKKLRAPSYSATTNIMITIITPGCRWSTSYSSLTSWPSSTSWSQSSHQVALIRSRTWFGTAPPPPHARRALH